jgi:hypothetical protein
MLVVRDIGEDHHDAAGERGEEGKKEESLII